MRWWRSMPVGTLKIWHECRIEQRTRDLLLLAERSLVNFFEGELIQAARTWQRLSFEPAESREMQTISQNMRAKLNIPAG